MIRTKINNCRICHEILSDLDNNFKSPTSGFYLCASCEAKYVKSCSECNKKDFMKFLFVVHYTKSIVCKSCFEEKYNKCYTCGNIFRKKDLVEKYEKLFCEHCFKTTFIKCHKCKREIIGFEEVILTGIDGCKYCGKCFNKLYGICARCRDMFDLVDGRRDENGNFLCLACFRRNSIVHDYSYLPKLKFLRGKKEKNTLFMGMELEVGKTKYDENIHPEMFLKFLKKLEVYNFYFLKRDRSISAFEIVSHPFSLLFAKKSMKINEIIKWLIKEDYNLSNCGFHVHLDKNYFSESEIIGMRIFFSRFKDALFLLSGRDNPNNEYCLYEKYCFKTMSSLSTQRGRHSAFNINTNKNTVEIRIFKGTFDYSLILAYLEFCQCLSTFTKTNDLKFISSLQKKKIWEGFISESKKFSNLYTLLKQKGLTKCA